MGDRSEAVGCAVLCTAAGGARDADLPEAASVGFRIGSSVCLDGSSWVRPAAGPSPLFRAGCLCVRARGAARGRKQPGWRDALLRCHTRRECGQEGGGGGGGRGAGTGAGVRAGRGGVSQRAPELRAARTGARRCRGGGAPVFARWLGRARGDGRRWCDRRRRGRCAPGGAGRAREPINTGWSISETFPRAMWSRPSRRRAPPPARRRRRRGRAAAERASLWAWPSSAPPSSASRCLQ